MVKIYQIPFEERYFYRDNKGSFSQLITQIANKWAIKQAKKLNAQENLEEDKIIDINSQNLSTIYHPFQEAVEVQQDEVMPFAASDEEIISIANKILEILRNPNEVFELLQSLEKDLKEELEKEKIVIPENSPQYLITGPGFYIPGPPKEDVKLCKQKKILSKLLLKREQKRGSKQQVNPVFVGIVKPKEAERFIRKEGLFSEAAGDGSLMLHGKEIHRLIFEVLMEAVKQGKIPGLSQEPGDLTQETLIKMFMKAKVKATKNGEDNFISMWDFLIDGFNEWGTYIDPKKEKRTSLLDQTKYTFSSRVPFNFQSILLCFADEKLPTLSKYLRNSTYKQGFKFVASYLKMIHTIL